MNLQSDTQQLIDIIATRQYKNAIISIHVV